MCKRATVCFSNYTSIALQATKEQCLLRWDHTVSGVSAAAACFGVMMVCVIEWSSDSQMTGLSCDHSSVEETPVAVLGWMPVSLSVCLPFWSYSRYTYTQTHSNKPAQRLIGVCLSYTYARMHTVNKLEVETPWCSDFSFGSTSPPANGGN